MKHYASTAFWTLYDALPPHVRELADKNFELLQSNPKHPSLHFKKIGGIWSARVGAHHRALAGEVEGDMTWFWIGTHADYDKIIR